MNYKAIIFDLDGTLLDTIEDIGDSMNRVLSKFDLPTHFYDEYKYFVGDGVQNLIIRSIPDILKNDNELIKDLINLYRENYSKNWAIKTKPYDGIFDLLNILSSKQIIMNVLTNKPHEITKIVVNRFLSKYSFDQIIGARENIPEKPDPGGAIEISSNIGINPEEMLYLGDTNTDMQTANAAKMMAIGVLWGFREKNELLLSGAKEIIKHPMDLIKFL